MRAVLTGDIIDSRKAENPQKWIENLQRVLHYYGVSPKDWELFRGDSFQLETEAKNAFEAAFRIKASIKTLKLLDVRISIGLGETEFKTESVTLNNGTSFIYSGEAFDQLKTRKRNLILSCENQPLQDELNMMLQLSEAMLENWSESSAIAVDMLFENPGISQTEMAKKLEITQPSVSARLRVAHADEIFALIAYYYRRIESLPQ